MVACAAATLASPSWNGNPALLLRVQGSRPWADHLSASTLCCMGGLDSKSVAQAALAQAVPPARPPGALGGSCGENDTAFESRAGEGTRPNGAAAAGAGKGLGAAAAAQPMAHFAAFRPEAGERAEDVAAALLGKARAPAALSGYRLPRGSGRRLANGRRRWPRRRWARRGASAALWACRVL